MFRVLLHCFSVYKGFSSGKNELKTFLKALNIVGVPFPNISSKKLDCTLYSKLHSKGVVQILWLHTFRAYMQRIKHKFFRSALRELESYLESGMHLTKARRKKISIHSLPLLWPLLAKCEKVGQ